MSYYSIYIPSKIDLESNDEPFVFLEKEEALKVLKNHKDARLKIFKSNEDAINYAQTGNEMCISKSSNLNSPINLEKIPFHGPTKQQLIQFRKAIEDDNYKLVADKIETNPRYLVNMVDTPTILKDGPRYNALHICAIHNRAEIATLLLKTISQVEFISYFHGQDNFEINQEVCNVLLDYYLNMPEKGRSETPLHLASKYGSVEVVEVLTAYPQCKMLPNLDNLLPRDIVCSRMKEQSDEAKEKILGLLEERFYVPVIRSVDNSIPATIGEPFSPVDPPKLNMDPMSPELQIQAYAGPIRSKEEAEKFRRRWKTPPRNGTSSSICNSPYISPLKFRSSTPSKPLNNNTSLPMNMNSNSVKKNLNANFEDTENENLKSNNVLDNNNSSVESSKFVFPMPLTPLLKNPKRRELFFTYRDKAASPLILDDSDSHSSNNLDISEKDFSLDSSGLKERHLKLSDTEKGFEIVGRELAKEQNIGWKEYWDFLDEFIDISSKEGLEKLEAYLKRRVANKFVNSGYQKIDFDFIDKKRTLVASNRSMTPNSNINSDLTKSTSQATTPHLCVEKSLQVFARRMTNTIIHNIDSVLSINDAFISELKRLKSLVCSFRDDIRFLNIDFNVIHSRFANLISTFLCHSPEIDFSSLQKIKKCFKQIIQSKKKSLMDKGNFFDEKEQLQCVSELILDCLESTEGKDKIEPENVKTEQICSEIWREELKCNCNWSNDSFKFKDARRKRRLARKLNKFNDINSTDIKSPEDANCVNDDDDDSDRTEDDEDVFWSDVGSDDDEKFFTPPESPTQSHSDDYDEEVYYLIKEDKPTKRDWDVLQALRNVDINKTKYPHIYRWKAAILRHSEEEYENFPSPSSTTRMQMIRNFHEMGLRSAIPRRLMSPTQSPLSSLRVECEVRDQFVQLTDETFNASVEESCSLRNDFSRNLSLLNISDV